MLLAELITSKRGPLAKVWLSAHQERKLSKQQALGVDVPESVDAILEQDEGPVALRMSGHLMLGVTKIYSRKVQYLLDDCKETRERITMAFRPGVVDLPEDQVRASKNAITFSDTQPDFNFLDWTWAAPPAGETGLSRGLFTAPADRTTLRPTTREFGAYNFGRPAASSIYGGSSASRHSSQNLETTSHLDSQDFSGDLDLQLDQSLEVGRDAGRRLSRERSASYLHGRREGSVVGSIRSDPIYGADVSFEPVDLGIDFGADAPPLDEPDRTRRETSALSTPPPTSPAAAITDLTPRTAQRIGALAQPKTGAPKRHRLLHADEELELPDEVFVAPGEDSRILGEERYIPADPSLIQLQQIVADPMSYFLPTTKVGGETMIFAGPQGLAPELASLFTFPSNVLRRDRSAGMDDARAAKRPRIEDDEDDVEIGRRGSIAPLEEDYGNIFAPADDTFDFAPPDQSMQFDLGPQLDILTPTKRPDQRQREPSLAPSRVESIAAQFQYEEGGAHKLAMFDSRTRSEVGTDSLQSTPSKSEVSRSTGGYSKNTGLAMGLLRREIEAIEEEDKVVSFERVAERATKKAAAAFFFELLVLGTKDQVKLDQTGAFGNLEIRGKERLFAEVTA